MTDQSLQPKKRSLIHQGHINPERLDEATRIIEPPTKIFLALSSISIFALFCWTIFAKIPQTVKATAIFTGPNSISLLSTNGDGLFFYKDDLLPNTYSSIDQLIKSVDTLIAQSNYSHSVAENSIPTIITDIDEYISVTNKAISRTSSVVNNLSLSSSSASLPNPITYQAGEVIGYVLNKKNASKAAVDLESYLTQKKNLDSQQSSYTAISQQNLDLEQAYVQRVKTLQYLSDRGIIAKSQILSAQKDLLTQRNSNSNQLISLKKAYQSLDNQLASLLATIYSSSENIQIRSNTNLKLVSKLLQSGQPVQSGDHIGLFLRSGGKSSFHDSRILAFAPLESSQGLSIGQTVRVSPVNVSKSKYGSIKGSITKISQLSMGKDSAALLLGTSTLGDVVFDNQKSMFSLEITLEKSNTSSGFKWSASQGPDFKIPLTTTADVSILVNEVSPISTILPALRSVTQ